MSNYRFEVVTRTEAQTGAPIMCLHVMIDSNSLHQIGDAYIPMDEILEAWRGRLEQVIEESKYTPLTLKPPMSDTFAPIHHQIDNQQRYIIYLVDTGGAYRLDTWTGQTWALAAKADGQYWKPFIDNAQASEEPANG